MTNLTNLTTSCDALLLECIVYCHGNPGRTRKALLFCYIVDGVNDIGRKWYIDDNVQATFKTINQPCDLTGKTLNKRSLFASVTELSRATIGQ